jgi:hypothetical protein
MLEYRPVPGNFGNLQVVAEPFYFESVETPQGRITRGQVSVEFARDGTADYTEIYLEDAQGDQIALDVQPLDAGSGSDVMKSSVERPDSR